MPSNPSSCTATPTVQAAPASGGGGGLDALTLLALTTLLAGVLQRGLRAAASG